MDCGIDRDHSRQGRPDAVQLTLDNVQSAVRIRLLTEEADWKTAGFFLYVTYSWISVSRMRFIHEFRTNRMSDSQQFDFADDGGRSGEFHIIVGHIDAQSAATHGDRPMVDACFGTQGDGGSAQARAARQRLTAAAFVDSHGGAALVVVFALFVDAHEFNVLVALDLGRDDRLGH